MAPRRRALRDHQDARPIVASAQAALRDAEQAASAARKGLRRHFEKEAYDRVITNRGSAPSESSESASS